MVTPTNAALDFQIGANGYVFAVNNNGQVMLHPRLKSAVSLFILEFC